jgi:transglutaminase-like putative cysteine protease
MPRFRIYHRTKYTYETPVRDSANQIVLFPIKDEFQEVLSQELKISGDPDLEIFKDFYGNEIGSFMRVEAHDELVIDSKIEVITKPRPAPVDPISVEGSWSQLHLLRFQAPYIDFLRQEKVEALEELRTLVNSRQTGLGSPLVVMQELNEFVYSNFKYIKGVTSVETTLDEIWKLKAGVCQDFAHILLMMLRLIHIPSRYVSGYICPGLGGMRGEGATHAWVESYIPSYGWLGLDPTNNCIAGAAHVRLAVGRNFSDCSPVKGTYKGKSGHVLEVGVSVSYEDGRITEEESTVLTQQPVRNKSEQNSYRRYLEMMQQQQQQ